MTINVDVTQDDIDHGVRNDCRRCPVARAATRLLPGFTEATPGMLINFPDGKVHKEGKGYKVYLIEGVEYDKVSDFMLEFDYDRPVKPFSFIARLRVA